MIVHQSSNVNAWALCASGDPSQATADNGLGSTATSRVDDDDFLDPNTYIMLYWHLVSQECDGDKYQVIAGADTIVEECSPALSATPTEDFIDSWGYDESVDTPKRDYFLNYTVTITPIQVTLTGSVMGSPGSYQCLVGQQVTAHLSITPDPDDGSDGAPAYHWTEDGGKPFTSYSASSSAGILTPIDPAIYEMSSPTFHFAKNDGASFSCHGSIHGQPFTVTALLSIVLPVIRVVKASIGPSSFEPADTGLEGNIGLLDGDDFEAYPLNWSID